MRWWRHCFLGVLCLLVVQGLFAESTFRIATLNLDNYLVMDRWVDGAWRKAYPKPEREVLAVHAAIQAVEADVLVVQEVGSEAFLRELQGDLKRLGLDYPYIIHLQGNDRARHVAVLSRVEPAQIIRHQDLDFAYFDRRQAVSRGLLEVVFELAGAEPFRLYALHLKSRRTTEKADPGSVRWRVREAEACRDRILERGESSGISAYLVAGDFNDDPGSGTLRRFYQRGERRLGQWVPAVDSRGEVWTHFYAKGYSYSTVDGFVASPEVASRVVGGQGHILDVVAARAASDHRLVYVDLSLDED